VLLAGDLPRVEIVLGQLKKHPDTRHLPVVVLGNPVRPHRRAAVGGGGRTSPSRSTRPRSRVVLERLDRLADHGGRRIALVESEHARLDDELTALNRRRRRRRAGPDRPGWRGSRSSLTVSSISALALLDGSTEEVLALLSDVTRASEAAGAAADRVCAGEAATRRARPARRTLEVGGDQRGRFPRAAR